MTPYFFCHETSFLTTQSNQPETNPLIMHTEACDAAAAAAAACDDRSAARHSVLVEWRAHHIGNATLPDAAVAACA
jgi:hypothetical protein